MSAFSVNICVYDWTWTHDWNRYLAVNEICNNRRNSEKREVRNRVGRVESAIHEFLRIDFNASTGYWLMTRLMRREGIHSRQEVKIERYKFTNLAVEWRPREGIVGVGSKGELLDAKRNVVKGRKSRRVLIVCSIANYSSIRTITWILVFEDLFCLIYFLVTLIIIINC